MCCCSCCSVSGVFYHHILFVPPLSRAVWALATGRNINESLPSVKESKERKRRRKKKKCFFHPSQTYIYSIYIYIMYSTVIETQISFTVGRSCVWPWHNHHWPYNNREDKKKERKEIEDGWIRCTPYSVSLSISFFFFLTNTQSLFLPPHLSLQKIYLWIIKELVLLFFFLKKKREINTNILPLLSEGTHHTQTQQR
jgi:hypothetical protein